MYDCVSASQINRDDDMHPVNAHLDFISANDHIRADWKKLDKKKIEAATRVLFSVMTKLICSLGRKLHLTPEDSPPVVKREISVVYA